MYFNIALKNVKKSFKDYTIYFVTLTLAVCVFYSFNSIESQKALIEIKSSDKEYIDTFTKLISIVSVFISVILGCLMIYANNFLIKKRNKELGIYMTLGMSKLKISNILTLETLLVAILSLVSGLFLGLFTSQGLSVLVSNFFDLSMKDYEFFISFIAIKKTIFYFGIMFLFIVIFNSRIISKYNIIDLLVASRKNENIKIKNSNIFIFIFLISLISLFIAYKIILKIGLSEIKNPLFLLSISLGILGTFLFFFSLSSIILFVVKSNKQIYLKGLNIFVIKQISSKINTNFMSMSVICLMLFFTICILSTGMSFKSTLESTIKLSTPFDATLTMYIYEDDKIKSVKESLNKIGFKIDEGDKYVYFDEYVRNEKIRDILNIDDKDFKSLVNYVKISEYNNILQLMGKNKIDLKDDEVLILSNYDKYKDKVNEFLKENKTIHIEGKEYKIKNNKAIEHNLTTNYIPNNIFTVIINDKFCDNAIKVSSNININYNNKKYEDREKEYFNLNNIYRNGNLNLDETGFLISTTKEYVYSSSKGLTTTMTFIGIYIGIVFLISSMAVLALQQLSEASDSIDRYTCIKRIGASEKGINKTIFIQTLIYFIAPISLSLIHSIIGIKVANDFVGIYGKPNILTSSLITSLIFTIIYISYFYATYIGYKNIVKSKLK